LRALATPPAFRDILPQSNHDGSLRHYVSDVGLPPKEVHHDRAASLEKEFSVPMATRQKKLHAKRD
jgi:hypothetical protein